MLTLTKNKTILVFTIMILILSTLGLKSFALVNPTSNFYVADYANLIDADVEEYIINTNKILNEKTGAQIVVVTVPNLENQSLEEYATALFRKFGIGDKTKNNGVLMLLALEERQFRIEVGYGLEGILPDGKTGRIQDEYIIPYLKDNNWNEGIRNGYSKILEEVSKEYEVDVGTITANKAEISDESYNQNIIEILVIVIVMFSMIPQNKKIKLGILTVDAISFISVLIFKNKIPQNILTNTISIQVIVFIITIISFFGKGRYFGGGWRSGGGFSGGGFSGGGSFGGDGSSGGGGSSRSF